VRSAKQFTWEVGGEIMQRRIERWLKWCLAGTGAGVVLFQVQGCTLDPDIYLRAGVSLGSDVAIFLLENLAASL
jgi:hypothetical protein